MPALREEERMSAVPAFFETCGDRYRLASFDLSGFTVYTLLRGFENAMQDFLLDPDGFAALDGPDRRFRVRPDADGGAAWLPRHPFRRRLGHADRA